MKRIQLTENQLHRIITESVYRILEDYGMDWRTAANAAYQSANADPQRIAQYDAKHGQGAWNKRGDRFNGYALNSFNKHNGMDAYDQSGEYAEGQKYGANRFRCARKNPRISTYQVDDNNNQLNFDMETDFNKGQNPQQVLSYNQSIPWTAFENGSQFDGNYDLNTYHKNRQGYNAFKSRNPNVNQAARRGNQQINDYMNGNSRYVKGQGWQ
jgi:hypothetical protein